MAKPAVTLLSPSITTVAGFPLPERFPDHSENSWHESGTAPKLTVAPHSTLPDHGRACDTPSTVTDPPSPVRLSVYSILAKSAVTDFGPSMTTRTGLSPPDRSPPQESNS